MKITDVDLTLFAWEGIPPTTYGKHTGKFGGRSHLGLLTITTDDGIRGHAFLGSAMRGAHLDGESLIEALKPVVLGQDPLDRERHYYRESVPAYASSAVLPSAPAYAEEAAKFKSQGWLAYKIHPPTDPQLDIEVCRAVRKAVGDGFTLMLDGSWAYQYPEALRVGKAIEELGYHWYEDPLADDDLYTYVKLKQQLHIPILATEYSPGGFTAFAPWITAHATDFLRGDVAVKAGITSLVKTAHLAEAFHMNLEVHHGGNSLNNVANLHVIMAIKNCEFFEVLLPAGAQKYGLVEDIEVDSNGLVHAMGEPGLGAAIDFDLIERRKTAVLR